MTVVVLYGRGGELDREPVTGTHMNAISEAVDRLVLRCTLNVGDTIRVEGDENGD